MSNMHFTKEHEWVRVDGDVVTCGVTEFAQEQLGDVVYVELPDVGRNVSQNEEIAVVESVKAASEVYAPVSGEVVAVNDALSEDPAKVMKILQDCLEQHPKILKVPEPSVIFMNFGESSLDFQARGFIANVLYRLFVASDLRVAIDKAFAEAGIEIPFPQRDLHLKDIDQLRQALPGRAGRADGQAVQDGGGHQDQSGTPS